MQKIIYKEIIEMLSYVQFLNYYKESKTQTILFFKSSKFYYYTLVEMNNQYHNLIIKKLTDNSDYYKIYIFNPNPNNYIKIILPPDIIILQIFNVEQNILNVNLSKYFWNNHNNKNKKYLNAMQVNPKNIQTITIIKCINYIKLHSFNELEKLSPDNQHIIVHILDKTTKLDNIKNIIKNMTTFYITHLILNINFNFDEINYEINYIVNYNICIWYFIKKIVNLKTITLCLSLKNNIKTNSLFSLIFNLKKYCSLKKIKLILN